MSTQIHVDPEELDWFAARLESFCDDLSDRLTALNHDFNTLSGSWSSTQQQHFEWEFQKAEITLKQFLLVSETHIPWLRRMAEDFRNLNASRV